MIRKLLAGMCYDQARWALGLGRLGMAHAYRLLRTAVLLWPNHPEARHWMNYLQGRLYLERGEAERAVQLLQEAERALPQTLAVRMSLGLAYTLVGKEEQGISTLERVLREDASVASEEAWVALAWSYLRTGRAPKAREVCRRAAEMEVHSARLEMLYRLATAVGIESLPTTEMRQLLRATPESLPMLLEYARLQAQDGRHRLARAAVGLLAEEDQAASYGIIGRASLNEDDLKTAHWAAEQVLRTKDEEYLCDGLLLRSEVALRRGDYAEAASQARRALEADENDGRAHEQLGRALLLQGDWGGAASEMVEALHRGQGGALAAGVTALEALERGDLETARAVLSAPGSGDALGCLLSHAAQAALLASEGKAEDAQRATEWASQGLKQLPVWAARPEVVSRVEAAIRPAHKE